MTLNEIYRARAAALVERAKFASTPTHKKRFKRMALSYERLAEKYESRIRIYKKMPHVTVEGPKKSKIRKRMLQID
jgi:hypothetical protein